MLYICVTTIHIPTPLQQPVVRIYSVPQDAFESSEESNESGDSGDEEGRSVMVVTHVGEGKWQGLLFLSTVESYSKLQYI